MLLRLEICFDLFWRPPGVNRSNSLVGLLGRFIASLVMGRPGWQKIFAKVTADDLSRRLLRLGRNGNTISANVRY